MPRGTQDYGSIVSSFGATQIDVAELSYLLAGYGLIDGLGRTVLADNFRFGLGGWNKSFSGTGVIPQLVNDTFESGGVLFSPPFACYLNGGVTANGISLLSEKIFLGSQVKLGIELGFYINPPCADLSFQIVFVPSVGTGYYALVKISATDNKIYIRTTGGVYQQIGILPVLTAGVLYRAQLKMVGDWSLGVYHKLLFGENAYSVDGIPLIVTSAVPAGVADFVIFAASRGGASIDAYIGFVRCSKDEP